MKPSTTTRSESPSSKGNRVTLRHLASKLSEFFEDHTGKASATRVRIYAGIYAFLRVVDAWIERPEYPPPVELLLALVAIMGVDTLHYIGQLRTFKHKEGKDADSDSSA